MSSEDILSLRHWFTTNAIEILLIREPVIRSVLEQEPYLIKITCLTKLMHEQNFPTHDSFVVGFFFFFLFRFRFYCFCCCFLFCFGGGRRGGGGGGRRGSCFFVFLRWLHRVIICIPLRAQEFWILLHLFLHPVLSNLLNATSCVTIISVKVFSWLLVLNCKWNKCVFFNLYTTLCVIFLIAALGELVFRNVHSTSNPAGFEF